MIYPTVTVIIPNYNHQNYLNKRLESVLNQSYQDFEVILLDDASTDASVSLLKTYQSHPKVSRLIVNNVNSGSLFKQWIKGIQLAQGNYIWIAESDDYSHPDFLKDTVEKAMMNEKTSLVFTDSYVVDENENILYKASIKNKALIGFIDSKKNKIQVNTLLFTYLLNDIIIWNASSVLFSRSALLKVDQRFLETLNNAGDLFTYLSLVFQYEIQFVNKPLNFYRKHSSNTTPKNIASGNLHKDRIRIVNYFISEFVKIPKHKTPLKLFLKRHFFTAINFKFYNELFILLKQLYKEHIISFKDCFQLKLYIYYSKLSYNRIPHFYRKYIEKLLS